MNTKHSSSDGVFLLHKNKRQHLINLLVPCLVGFFLHTAWGDNPIVTVESSNTISTNFMGFGVQLDPYMYPPSQEDWNLTKRRLDALHPAWFRVMCDTDDYCLGFDAAGNPRYAWNEKASDASCQHFRSLLAILDYAQSRNIPVILGDWAPWGLPTPADQRVKAPDDPRWARACADLVKYLISQRHYTVIHYFNLMNEPNGGWMWPKNHPPNIQEWAQGLLLLRHDLDAGGLSHIVIIGPDNVSGWRWLETSAKQYTDRIGAWDVHWYANDTDVVEGEVEKLFSEKLGILLSSHPTARMEPKFLGECGMRTGRVNGDQQPRVKTFTYGVLMADFASQVMRSGWDGASGWDLDDAMHVVKKPAPDLPSDTTLKIWGFWNTQAKHMGHPEDLAIRPWFYTWSLLCRFFPPGAKILTVNLPAIRGLRGSACNWNAASGHQHSSVVLVNDTDQPCRLTLQLPKEDTHRWTMYHYFEKDRPVDAEGFPIPKGTITTNAESQLHIDFPSRGVIFLTTATLPPK